MDCDKTCRLLCRCTKLITLSSNLLEQLQSKNLYHAYGIHGNVETLTVEVLAYIAKKLGVATDNNPDFIHERYETLAINDVRALRDTHAGLKFAGDAPRIFLLEIFGATREAQNGLLKILEEPKEGNHFFLIIPSTDILLPTLRSRLQIVNCNNDNNENKIVATEATTFIAASLKERMATVATMATAVSDEKTAKHSVINFLNSLEYALYVKAGTPDKRAQKASIFATIALARTYMNDRAPSIKMLLEYVALSV